MGSYKKKLFIVLLLILLLNFFVCGSVNATGDNYYQQDTTYIVEIRTFLENQQEVLAKLFITRFEQVANANQINTYKSYIKNNPGVYTPYFTYSNTSGGDRVLSCYFIRNDIKFNTLDNVEVNTNSNLYYDDNISYPITGYNLDKNIIGNIALFRIRLNNTNINIENTNETIFLPTLLIYYNNETLFNYVNGFKPSESLYGLIINSINANTEQQAETTEEMKKLNDFMSSEDVDQDSYDMPTTNPTQDPTTDGINNIFNKFYSRITNWDSSNISVYIPFANKSFTIPANASEQLLAKFSNMGLGSTLKSLISAVWFYVLARYIIKDVQKYVDGLKTGEILTKSDTNIKTEML